MRKLCISALAFLVIAACSSTSGVKGDLVFGMVTGADWAKYCNWHDGEVDSIAGKSCGDGSILPNPHIDCNSKNPVPNCTATVSQVEDCVHKYKDHACDGLAKVVATCNSFPPSCNAILAGSNVLN